MQKVLTVSTIRGDLRSEVIGWTFENGDALMESVRKYRKYDRLDIPVGFIGGSLLFPKYPTVLHAIGDGWKLLAPPSLEKDTGYYEWWLVKD